MNVDEKQLAQEMLKKMGHEKKPTPAAKPKAKPLREPSSSSYSDSSDESDDGPGKFQAV